MEEHSLEIPIKIESYDDLFSEFDYRRLEERELNDEIDSLIDISILNSNKKIKEIELELIIHMPLKLRDKQQEEEAKKGIINYYNSYSNCRRRMNILGIRRIIYYIVTALLLFWGWSFIMNDKGETFFGALLNAGGTVLLWEIMSLVLIEGKSIKEKISIKRKMHNMNIMFKYIE